MLDPGVGVLWIDVVLWTSMGSISAPGGFIATGGLHTLAGSHWGESINFVVVVDNGLCQSALKVEALLDRCCVVGPIWC